MVQRPPIADDTLSGRPPGSDFVRLLIVAIGALSLIGLARFDFLLFHAAVELLSVAVVVAIFSIGWNTRAFVRDNLLLILAMACLPIGLVDALHMLSYKGMGVFSCGGNEPTQLWIVARLIEAAAFLLGAWLVDRRPVHASNALWGFLAPTVVLLVAIHPLDVFPVCFVEGEGLTTFKVVIELVVTAVLAAAGWLLWKRRASVPSIVLQPLLAALVAKVLSELCFTSYVSVYGATNALGHVFKLISAALMYAALVEGTLRRPYATLFHGLAKSQQELERELGQRRKAQEELAIAKEAAEAANRAKSDFLANMSHEVRTPMHAIKGATELVLSSDLAPEQREFLCMARASTDSLLGVINDILDFSKIEAGRVELECVPFDLHDTVERAVEALALIAHQKRLRLVCNIHRDVPKRVVGDAGRLRQVLVNLLGNAVKFTDSGEVVLRVTAPTPAANGEQGLQFSVEDTGPGIAREAKERVFSTFYQADSSLTRKKGGTGLGLSITRRIVALMHGTVWLESEEGKGTTLFIDVTLPLAVDDTPQPAKASVRVQGRKALVVDAHEATREAIVEILEGWGAQVAAAADADAALCFLKGGQEQGTPFRFMIIDEESLDDLWSLLGKSETLPVRSVVVTSPPAIASELHRRTPSYSKVIKPVRRQALLEAVERAFDPTIPPADSADPAHARPAVGNDSTRLRVLLAEDNPVNQRIAIALLQREKHEVVAVRTGREALEAMDQGRFDVVLMDVEMPEMDGLEATRRIRERPRERGGETPIIGLTAHAMQGDREIGLAAGMSDYVSKPVRMGDLIAAVDRNSSIQTAPTLRETTDKSVDLNGFLEFVGADEAVAEEIVAVFLEDLPGRVESLQEALERSDATAVSRAAHALKGSLSTFGARRAQQLAASLEAAGQDGRLDSAAPTFAQLLEELGRVREDLRSVTPDGA